MVVLAACGALGCARPNAPASPAGAGDQGGEQPAGGAQAEGSVKEQFAREADPIQKQVVRAGDAFTAYIEARSAPKIERKGPAWNVTADVGWGGSSVQCFVYDEPIDTGTAAHTMLKAAAKGVTFKGLGPYFLDHLGLDPIVGIRGVYHVERNGTTMAGDLKLAVVPRSERPVMCWHDAPGYAKSFARLTTEFANSFQFKSTMPEPVRAELWTITLDGTPIGFSRDAFYRLADGNIRKTSLSARFLPIAPGEMAFNDEAEISTSDTDGALTAGRFIELENGESKLTIDVERTKWGYDYVGTSQNKEVKGSFKAKQPIKVRLAFDKKLRALGGKTKKARFEQWEYHPSLDVAKGSRVSYDVSSTADGMTIVSKLGSRSATLRATPRGIVKHVELAVGAKRVLVDLVEEKGEL